MTLLHHKEILFPKEDFEVIFFLFITAYDGNKLLFFVSAEL